MSDDILARGLSSQMLAALYTLKSCIDRCPDKEWQQRQDDYPFSQVVFHTLFDCDFSLSAGKDDLLAQAFHTANAEVFADYEELAEGPRKGLYERSFVLSYYDHCIAKVKAVVESQGLSALLLPKGDVYGNMTRAERYVNATRHIQHHAAQLGLRLQFLTGTEMDWVSKAYEG